MKAELHVTGGHVTCCKRAHTGAPDMQSVWTGICW